MAFDLVSVGGYGSGELGDLTVTNANTKINSVAKVVELIDDDSLYPAGLSYACRIERDSADGADSAYSSFTVGAEVLFITAGFSNAAMNNEAGCYEVRTITSISGDIVTFDNSLPCDPADYAGGTLPDLAWHIIPIPHFKNVTINSGASLIPSTDAPLIFKCSGTLTLNGGHIDLRSGGLWIYSSDDWADWEAEILSDTGKHAGWENFRTKNYLKIGGGDGAAFIIAKKLVVADNTSRIGNPQTSGVQFCRGSADSRAGTPTNTTIQGGSNILLVASTIEGFTPAIIAKYRSLTASEISAGKLNEYYNGLASCYIASDTRLRNDEGLYAYDGISNENRLTNSCNVHDFGDGSSGSFNATSQVNNYACVTAVDETGQVFTVADKTTNGTELFAVGTLVMVHCSSKANTTRTYHGRFFLAKILGINGNDITLDTAASGYQKDVTNYQIQLVTIPRFTNFTLNSEYTAVPKFTEKNVGTAPNTGTAQGGIFAIAVSGTCDLTNGQINVEGKGGAARYGSAGLEFIGNAQNRDKLPIGEGHGSVFILANKLIMNANTRIGATYSGAVSEGNYFGGTGRNYAGTKLGGGYEAVDLDDRGKSGWGGGNGTNSTAGGYGSNGKNTRGTSAGLQGAHVMIIADTITGFNMAAISTGGAGGPAGTTYNKAGSSGSAGYGGGGSSDSTGTSLDMGFGGGYNGGGGGGLDSGADDDSGGGGASGWAFIYCNNATYQSTENISL